MVLALRYNIRRPITFKFYSVKPPYNYYRDIFTIFMRNILYKKCKAEILYELKRKEKKNRGSDIAIIIIDDEYFFKKHLRNGLDRIW